MSRGTSCGFCGVACISETGARRHFDLAHTDDSPNARRNREVMEMFEGDFSVTEICLKLCLSDSPTYAIIRRGLEHPNAYMPAPNTFEFYALQQRKGERRRKVVPIDEMRA